ncbi:MAG TPA: M20/M25/M40 family metallo-hydrolase [Flavobacteriaceae bacterium]|nr:M20/M25/M40 family metallo-hydrolase [Flavobacteriaceae bacterium]
MRKLFTLLLFSTIYILPCQAQQDHFFATMDQNSAEKYVLRFPEGIEIIATENTVCAVKMTTEIAEIIKKEVKTHGSNYIFMPSIDNAIEAVQLSGNRPAAIDFTITETAFVNECLDLISVENIEQNIIELQNYGTRHHSKPQARQAVLDQKMKWDNWIAATGRTDIHTRIYEHQNTPMPSVILTIDGANNADEYVIVGGHIDSTTWNPSVAPGADDNASGIASLNEMVRVLLEKNFIPSRTVEVMAFAAEEIGLVGSGEIAQHYKQNNKNVLAYVQFDMTGYNGSSDDVYIMTDYYTSSDLNLYLTQLMDHYNSSGDHSFSYNYSECGYGCSDHASWAANGYSASMPFEAAMGEDNPFIHTANDIFSVLETGEHAAKFAKLGLQFIVEAAKPQIMNTTQFNSPSVTIYQRGRELFYSIADNWIIDRINILNATGQKVQSFSPEPKESNIHLDTLASGIYLIEFKTSTGFRAIRKILIF